MLRGPGRESATRRTQSCCLFEVITVLSLADATLLQQLQQQQNVCLTPARISIVSPPLCPPLVVRTIEGFEANLPTLSKKRVGSRAATSTPCDLRLRIINDLSPPSKEDDLSNRTSTLVHQQIRRSVCGSTLGSLGRHHLRQRLGDSESAGQDPYHLRRITSENSDLPSNMQRSSPEPSQTHSSQSLAQAAIQPLHRQTAAAIPSLSSLICSLQQPQIVVW